MSDRLLVNLGDDGRVSVSTWQDGGLPGAVAEPLDLVWPVDENALEDLRWYLEDYLRMPYGVYAERGAEVESKRLLQRAVIDGLTPTPGVSGQRAR